jgi:hypothetical protein
MGHDTFLLVGHDLSLSVGCDPVTWLKNDQGQVRVGLACVLRLVTSYHVAEPYERVYTRTVVLPKRCCSGDNH